MTSRQFHATAARGEGRARHGCQDSRNRVDRKRADIVAAAISSVQKVLHIPVVMRLAAKDPPPAPFRPS